MKKTIKILLAIVVLLLCIILIFNWSFGYLIKSQIANLTNNSITLDYKKSKARLLIGSIEFEDAVLFFDDVSIDSNSSIFIKSVSFDKFALSHLSLKALLFNRSFNIEKLLLSGPDIDLLKDTSINRKDIFSKILTPQVVSNKSQSAPFSFEFGEVEIDQGSFTLFEANKDDFKIGSLNLKLSNIGMEDLKLLDRNTPDLNANFDIQLRVYDIQKQLDDKTAILIDSIVYKKDKRLIQTGGIELNQLNTSSEFAESEISLSTDLISVNGFSLSHLLSTRDLKFNRLTIANTNIIEKLSYFDSAKKTENKPVSKRKALSNMVNAFITDTFNIQNFNYRSINTNTDSVDFINNLNLWAYSIHVDSSFILEKEYLKPIEKSKITSGSISMHMPERGIDFFCDTLIYSGPGKEQLLTNVQLNTYPSLFSGTNNQPTFQFNSDSILIMGLDEREWIDSSIVNLSVYLKNPQVIGSNVNFEKSKKTNSPGFAADKIILNDLNLENGSIKLKGRSNEELEISALDLQVVDLEIFSNEKPSNKKVSWKNIYTSFKDLKLNLQKEQFVQLGHGTISNNNMVLEGIMYNEIHIQDNYESSSKRLPDTSRIIFDKIKIDNFDIQALIQEKRLSIDRLELLSPEYFQYTAFVVENKIDPDSISHLLLYKHINKLIPNYFSLVDIKNLSIRNANVKYQLEKMNTVIQSGFSLEMNEIIFDTQFSDPTTELTIDNYTFCLTDVGFNSDKHGFISESICYNSLDDDLTISNSYADSKELNSLQYIVTLPKVTMIKPNFKPLSGGPFSFELIHLVDPEINIQIPEQKKQDKKIAPSDFKILPFAFLEDGVKIENGKVFAQFTGDSDSTTLEINQIDFDAHEIFKIFGAEKYHTNKNNIFSYLDFNLHDVSLNGPGLNLLIENINYDNQSGILSINPIEQEMFEKPGAKPFKTSINIPNIKIEHPDIMMKNNRVKSYGATNLLIPIVNVSHKSTKKNKEITNKNKEIKVNDSVLRTILGKVDFFHMDSTHINDIGFSQTNLSDSSGGTFDIERVSLLIDKLKIDSSHFDFREKRFAQDIVLQLYDKEIITADSMYHFKIKNVAYYYSRDKIVIDSFEVIPGYERQEFFKKAGFQTDLMQLKFNSAIAEGIDLLSIIENRKVMFNKLTLNKFHLMDHRDQHYDRKENDFKKLPKESLFNLPFALKIDTINVNNSFILYGEYLDKSSKPGEVFFTNFDASIYNVTNLNTSETNHDSLFAHITADIMNVSKMTVNLTIPLAKNNDNFWINGNIEKLDLRNFNSMTENLFGLSIVRGRGGLEIPLINMNSMHSKGSILFEYKRLKLASYNRDQEKISTGLGSGIIDFFLNDILIRKNNPAFLGKTRIGDVYAERNNERSFFNYIWKSTMSGLMATMGYYNKDLREVKKERKDVEKIERYDQKQLKKLK